MSAADNAKLAERVLRKLVLPIRRLPLVSFQRFREGVGVLHMSRNDLKATITALVLLALLVGWWIGGIP